MKYWQAKKLTQTEFKRLTGVKKTFRVMVRTVKAQEKEKKETRSPAQVNSGRLNFNDPSIFKRI